MEHQPFNFTDLNIPVKVSNKTISPTVITRPCIGVKNNNNPAKIFNK